MLFYEEIGLDILKSKDVYVYGAGMWGRTCKRHLEKNGVKINAFIDRDDKKIGTVWDKVGIISLEDYILRDCNPDTIVIIAMEKFMDVYFWLAEQMEGITCFYMMKKCYYIKNRTVLGTNESDELARTLRKKRIYLVGGGKYKADFLYIYKDIEIGEIFAEEMPKELSDENVVIVCDFKDCDIISGLPEGYIYNQNYVFGEDLFCLLDSKGMIGVPGIPSVMMKKTLYDPMQNQYICKQAFWNLQISSRFSVHCCCSDWGEEVGNLYCNTLDEIWNSINLKIFRLSMINRTYSFCNKYNCVHLKTQADPTSDRLSGIADVKPYASYLEIGIDRTCNLYCGSCREEICVESGKKKERIEKVKEDIIQSGWLDHVDKVLLGGQGEVFFSQIYQDLMFKNAANRKTLDLRTNGTLLDKKAFLKLESIYEKLAITVSIDAAKKETYDELRRSHNKNTWNNLMNNLEYLSEMRKEGKIYHFQINMCVQMRNYKEIPEFIAMGKRWGVDLVYITPIRNWGTFSDEQFRNIAVIDENKDLREEVKTVLENPILEDPIVCCML